VTEGEGRAFPSSPLHLESVGEGEPELVLVHGFGASSHSWRKWVPRLKTRHRLHLVDLMGFGKAVAPAGGDYSPRAQAARLVEVLRRIRGSPLVLVGHSLGAAVTVLAALRIRDEGGAIPLKGLILIGGAVYPQKLPPYLSMARIRPLGDLLLLPTPPRWAMKRGLQGIVHDPATVDLEQVEGYREPLRRFRRRRAVLRAARQLDLADGERLAARLREVAHPVLLIWGREDPVVPVEMGERLSRGLSRARLEVLDGVGHLPPEEAPEASVVPVLEFLGEL
jgi:pimeloyl-ACP methyl ester carboxylesterase